jgi:predicted phosphodiesterase
MSNATVMSVGGSDYNMKDTEARTAAMNLLKTQAYWNSDDYAFAWNDDIIYLYWNQNLVVRGSITLNTTLSTVLSNVGSTYTSTFPNTSNSCLIVPDTYSFVYDTSDSTYKVVLRNNVTAYQIVLLSYIRTGNLYDVRGALSVYFYDKKYAHVNAFTQQAYFNDNYAFTTDSSNNILMIWGGQLILRGKNANVNKTDTNAKSDVGSAYVSNNMISLPETYDFVFDYTTQKFAVISRLDYNVNNHCLLAENMAGKIIGGAFLRYWQENKNTRYNPKTTVDRFVGDIMGVTTPDVDSFLFFTDPHWMSATAPEDFTTFDYYTDQLQQLYDAAPCDFCVSGGDWLNNSATPLQGAEQLARIDAVYSKKFRDFYSIIGNHDTNYQGTTHEALSNTIITNLWYRKYGKNYYTFNTHNCKYIVLDSGIDWELTMSDYRWGQIAWLAEQMEGDCAILIHILLRETEGTPAAFGDFTDNITKLANAFNNKTTITLNGTTYDFTNSTGTMHFALGGHLHEDVSMTLNGIPCICPANATILNELNAYLTYFDKTGKVLKFVSTRGLSYDISLTTL